MVPRRALPAHERDEVLEVKAVRCAEPEKELNLYGTHLSGYKCVRLVLNQISVGYAEEFWVTSTGKYPQERFASDYNAMKPRGLENTELSLGERPYMRVDDAKVELEVRRFRAYGSKAILDVKIRDGGPLGVVRDLEGFSVKMEDHSRVLSMQSSGNHVLITYKMPNTPAHLRVFGLTRQGRSGADPASECDWPEDRISILARPTEFLGTYRIEVDKRLAIQVGAELGRQTTLKAYTKVKGTIGERILNRVLTLAGSQEIRNHPYSKSDGTGPNRKGPDSLRLVDLEPCYFEFKWWSDVTAARETAKQQLLGYRTKQFTSDYSVKGAYSVVLDWDVVSQNGRFCISRVW